MKEGALYIRVSTHMQDELSPDAQRRLGLEYAKSNDIFISPEHIYVESVSGRKAEKRPEFQRMVGNAKVKPRPFDVILVWKFSRFARNQEESIVYKSLLRKQCGIDVVSISEPIIEGPFGSLIERIIEWMDEYYSTRLSGEVTRGMTEKALRGGYQARPPLGYRVPAFRQTPVVVPEEADIVKKIFEKYVYDKMSTYDISRHLNSLGLKTSHNKPFEKRSIEYILQNPTYIGKIRWNRTENATNRIKDKSEWIITEGNHDPIISNEVFELAQQRFLTERKPVGARPSSLMKHWLGGILKCSSCGRTLTSSCHTDKRYGRTYYNFQCYGYHKGKCLVSHSISAKKIVPEVLDGLKEIIQTGNVNYEKVSAETSDMENDRLLLLAQINKIDDKEKRIKQAYRDGIDTLEEYKQNKLLLLGERERLQNQLDSLQPEADEDHTQQMLERISSVYDILVSEKCTYAEKNAALRSVVKGIIYDRENDSIEFMLYFS